MKKLLISPFKWSIAGSIFIASCVSNNKDGAMKVPIQSNADTATQKTREVSGKSGEKENEAQENEKNEQTSITTPTSYVPSIETNAKSKENMKAAFKGETANSAKYTAYSIIAEQEGYQQVALLFKAASISEIIHANNHKAVLQESNISVPLMRPEFTVKTNEDNLQEAIACETYEATTMYPDFLATAKAAGNQMEMLSLNFAYKTEKKHKGLYEAALYALQHNAVSSLPTVFYVCPTCGNTYEKKAPARCSISMTSAEKFIKINSLLKS